MLSPWRRSTTTKAEPTGLVPLPSSLQNTWRHTIEGVLGEATLVLPADPWWQRGGRQGQHSEHLTYLLAEMQVVHRAHPGATW